MDLPISEELIRGHASEQSFSRGGEYFREGAVIQLMRRGQTLEAEVEGSEREPYRMRVDFSAGSVLASCSCPYDWGDWCKARRSGTPGVRR
jgi:uncharacterized Zn finger protein